MVHAGAPLAQDSSQALVVREEEVPASASLIAALDEDDTYTDLIDLD